MLRRIFFVALCLIPVALCYRSTAAPAPAKGTGQLAIVPAQSQIVIQLHGIDRVRDRIKATLTAANPQWGDMAMHGWDMLMTNIPEGRKLQGLAPNGPHYAAFLELPDGMSAAPAMAFILRVNNYKTFLEGVLTEEERKKLTSDPGGFQSTEIKDQVVYFLEKPDYAIVTPSKDVAEKMAKSYDGLDSKMTASIAESFTTRDISIYVSMVDVNNKHGDTIRQIRDLMMMAIQPGNNGMDEQSAEAARKLYGGMFQLLLDSEVLVVTADFRPEGLAFQTLLRVGPESLTNGVLKSQKAGATEPLAKLPTGQMIYFGASGLTPETMQGLMAMNGGMQKTPDSSGKRAEEFAEAKIRSTFAAGSYPSTGVAVQEYDDAPRAMKATVALLEGIDEGGSYGGGFIKGKPQVKVAAQNHGDIAWTSFHMVWDFEKVAEMMPGGGDEVKATMKKFMGDELNGWIGVSGNRMFYVTAKDWDVAKKLIDDALKGQNAIGDSPAYQPARKALPSNASVVYLIDAGPIAYFMADNLLPMFKTMGMQIPGPETLTPVKFAPAFVGAAVTLQPEQGGLDVFVPVSAVTEVSKLVVQFYMGTN